jgi:signal transduction histidine kinase
MQMINNSWTTFVVVATHLPVLVALVGMSLFVILRGRRSAMRQIYVAIIISLIIWFIAILLRMQAPSATLVWLMFCLQYCGVCGFGLCLTLFGMVYLGEQRLSARIILPLSIPAATAYLLIVTNPLHYWFLRAADTLTETPGPIYAPILAINAIYVLLGLLLSCLGLYRRMQKHRLAAALFIAAILAPLLPYALYLLRILTVGIEPEPLLLTFSVLCFGMAALRFHLLDITPLARRTILNEIGSALAITDPQNRIIDYNQAMARLFEPAVTLQPFMHLSEIDPKILRSNREPLPQKKEIMLDTPEGIRLFELTVQAVCNRSGDQTGCVLRLADLDREHQLRQLLTGQHEQLETANQSLQRYISISSDLHRIVVRNRLAREMHDTIGHALIILIALLQRFVDGDEKGGLTAESSTALLAEAQEVLRQVLQHLSLAIVSSDVETARAGHLQDKIRALAHDMALTGIQLETDIRGQIEQIPADHHGHLLQICREALTNAVKHGKASTINLFLQTGARQYDLVILDNGSGTAEIEKGFGLQNMESRVTALGGSMRLQSDTSGFGIYITVPLPHEQKQTDQILINCPSGDA